MSIYVRIYANANDGYASSTSTSGLVSGLSDTAGTSLIFGGNGTRNHQSFIAFDTSAIASVGSAQLSLSNVVRANPAGSGSGEMYLRYYDWGTDVTTADWRTSTQFNALVLAGFVGALFNDTPTNYKISLTNLTGWNNGTTETRFLLNADTVSLLAGWSCASVDTSGTTSDPYLTAAAAGAWSIVGVSSVVETTTVGTYTLTEPAGCASGDLLVACIGYHANTTTSLTLPAGWTLVNEQKTANTSTNTAAIACGQMAYIVRGGSAPALGWTTPTGISVALGRIVAYRGGATTSPLDANTAATTATAVTAVSVAGLTTTQDDDLIVALCAGGQDSTWSGFNNVTTPIGASGATDTTTAPSSTAWIERADSLTANGTDVSLAVFDAVRTSTGATGNLTATIALGGGNVVIAGAFAIAGSAETGWSTTDKSANVAISGVFNTVASTTSSTQAGVRSAKTHNNESTGKYYAELALAASTPLPINFGITPTSNTLTATTSNFSVVPSTGGIRVNGVSDVIVIGASTTGDVISVAWDAGAEKVWFRRNADSWNASGTADPGSGTEGLDCSFAAATPHALWIRSTSAITPGQTLRTALGRFTQTVPSGFLPWADEAPSSYGVTVTPTGVAATGSVGGVTVDTGPLSVSTEVTGVAAIGSVGDASVRINSSTIPTGVAATGAVGDASATGKQNISTIPTGVAGTGAVGDVTASGVASISTTVSGVTAAGSVGDVTISTVARTDVSTTVTGVAATGFVGDVTASGTVNVSTTVTGVAATGAVGTATAQVNASVIPTGVAAIGAVGTASVSTVTNVSTLVTGVAAAGAVGTATALPQIGASTTVTGVAATGSVGDATVATTQHVTVIPTGVAANASVGDVLIAVAGAVTAQPSGVEAVGGTAGAYDPVVQVGTTLRFGYSDNLNTGTVSSAIEVPAEAEIILVGVSQFQGTSGGLAAMTFTKGGTDAAMTKVSGGDTSFGIWQAALFSLVAPDIGTNKTLKWDWVGTDNSAGAAALISVTFWKNIDPVLPIRHQVGTQSLGFPITTPTLEVRPGDRIVAFYGGYAEGAEGSIDSWTGLDELTEITHSSDADAAWAIGTASEDTTVAVASATGFTQGALLAVSLNPVRTAEVTIYTTRSVVVVPTGVEANASVGAAVKAPDYPDETVTGPEGDALIAVPGELAPTNDEGLGWYWHSGDQVLYVNGPNIELRSLDIAGPVIVNPSATDFLISNCRITTTTIVGIYLLATGGTAEYCQVIGPGGNEGVGISGIRTEAADCTITRCEVTGVENGIFLGGINGLVTDNYIHDLIDEIAFSAGDPHTDGIQLFGGNACDGTTIRHNNVIAPEFATSAMIMNTIVNLTVDNNRLREAGWTTYIWNDPSNSIINNRIAGGWAGYMTTNGGPGGVRLGYPEGAVLTGNVDDNTGRAAVHQHAGHAIRRTGCGCGRHGADRRAGIGHRSGHWRRGDRLGRRCHRLCRGRGRASGHAKHWRWRWGHSQKTVAPGGQGTPEAGGKAQGQEEAEGLGA